MARVSKVGRRVWVAAALAVVIGAGLGVLYAMRQPELKAAALAPYAAGSLAALHVPREPPPTPDHAFRGPDGAEVTLVDFRGKVVVLNLWAMWCRPCRTEMPTLAALARSYADQPDLLVLPVNVDATPAKVEEARAFLGGHAPLPLYSDLSFQLPFELPGGGAMPKTVILDRQGRIRACYVGESDWSRPEVRALLDALLAEPA